MNVRVLGGVGCAVLCALAAPSRAAGEATRGPSSITWAEGGRAPADAWLQEDGCAARTGATETVVFTGPREQAWKFEVKGEIEGEPLVWRGKTLVVEKAGSKRTLHVLSTETGAERMSKTFETPLPLAPVLGDGRVLVRASPKTLQGFAFGEKSLTPRWTATAKSSMGPPTAIKDDVFVVLDGALVKIVYGAPAPQWKSDAKLAAAAPPAGGKGTSPEIQRPSARGGSVYVVSSTQLIEVDRDSGHVVRAGGLSAVDPATARVIVGLGDVLVQTGKTFAGAREAAEDGKTATGATDADTVRLSAEGSSSFEGRSPLKLTAGVACLGRSWVGLMGGGDGALLGLLGVTDRVIDEGSTLANKDVHAEYLAVRTPPTAALDVAIVGGRMFDAGDRKVLQPSPLAGISRVIPTSDRLLIVETKNRLVAWRPAGKSPVTPPLLPPGTEDVESTALPAAHAVVEDGRVVAGPFTFDGKAGLLRAGSGKTAESWPVASVRAVVTDEPPLRLLLCARPRDAAWATAAAARGAAAAHLMTLLEKATKAKDGALSRRILTAAGERGAPEADLAKYEKTVTALEAAKGDTDMAVVAEVEDELKALTAREADVLLEAASSVPEAAPAAYATALVRAIVARSPYHPGATAWVRAHLPPGLQPPGFKDLADWLDFIEVRASANVRIFGPKEKVPDDVSHDVAEALDEARKEWRPDVVGFLNGSLLVESPPEHPAAIATCLKLGLIVSDTLDAAFSGVGPRRPDEKLMVLQLFPNKSEYLKAGHRGESGSFGYLENSSGYYSPSEGVTRIYWPSGGGGESVPSVYCHELTHHWVSVRRPKRPDVDDPGDRASGPGAWIVEGIADFLKDHAYDTVAGKAEPNNPYANYADVLAGLQPKDVYPWDHFLRMDQSEAYGGGGDPHREIKGRLRFHMGISSPTDPVASWYAQSASTTAFLYLGENGKYRPALMTFLYDHYAGNTDVDAFLSSIGLTADQLGAKIVAWCKALGGPPGK